MFLSKQITYYLNKTIIMYQKITRPSKITSSIENGIKLNIETFYQDEYSNPLQSEWMFAYRITIFNYNKFDIKLNFRHWTIFDSENGFRELEGEGVVGMIPIINSGGEYQYVSGCNFYSCYGYMKGYYKFEILKTKEVFQINIPKFEMLYPYKYN